MCTIVVLQHVREDFPVVIATNRDEYFARPATSATRLLTQPVAVGGRDLSAHGTWMGVTEQGVFVGLTNQRSFAGRDPSKRSRGELVLHALQAGSVEAVHRMLRAVDGRSYNGFNMMFGDARGLHCAYGREDVRELQIEPVPDGVHVLPNDRLDSAAFFKVGRARELLRGVEQAPWPHLQSTLKKLLADRERAPEDALGSLPAGSPVTRELLRELSPLCVKTPSYGSRSSTIVALEPGHVAHYLYADGPPDHASFEDVTPLFHTDTNTP